MGTLHDRRSAGLDGNGRFRSGTALAVMAVVLLAALDGCGSRSTAGAAGPGQTGGPGPTATAPTPPQVATAVLPVDPHGPQSYPKGTTAVTYRDAHGTVIGRGHLCDDLPIGPWIYAYAGGSTRWEGTFLYGGVRDGHWEFWYRSGRARSEGDYDHGLESGPWTYWHANGVKAAAGSYIHGLREGRWRTWDENGVASGSGEILDGNPVGSWHFTAPGGETTTVTSVIHD